MKNPTESLHCTRMQVLHPSLPMSVDGTTVYPSCSSQKLQVIIFLTFPHPELTYPVLQHLPPKSSSNPFFLHTSAVPKLVQPTITFLSYHSGLQTGLPTFSLASLPFILHGAASLSAATMTYKALVSCSPQTSLISSQSAPVSLCYSYAALLHPAFTAIAALSLCTSC